MNPLHSLQNSSAGGDALGSQLQQLRLQDNQPSTQHQGQFPPQSQQGAAHPSSAPPQRLSQTSIHDQDATYEPPPGPPPNWIPPAEKSQVILKQPAPISTQAEQVSQPPGLSSGDLAPRSQPPPKPSPSWKFPKPHPCGVTPLAECAGNFGNLDLDWFRHPSVPSFCICTRCYAEHVYDLRFHQFFEKVHIKGAEGQTCGFQSLRMKDQLWPAALASGDLGPALEYMKNITTLPRCPGATSVEGRSWYISVDIPGSTICQACFENVVMEPAVREKFTLQAIPNGCTCDLSSLFVHRLVKETKTVEHWENFAQGVSARISTPPCPKRGKVKAQGRPWYQTREGHPSLQICLACYLDYFVGTGSQELFNQVGGGDYDTHCDIGNSFLELPAGMAIEKEDQEIFWKAARVMRAQPCSDEGIQTNWYTLTNNPPGFGICRACYATVVEHMGAEHFFIDKGQFPSIDSRILCGFNPVHIRFADFFSTFLQSVLTGDLKYVGDYTAKFGNVLTCPRDHYRRGKNRKFWGWGVSAICEECYISFAKGTSLEGSFALKGDPDPKGRMCDMYSPRMRRLYMEACETGDLRGFLAIGEQRHQVWCDTIAVCDRIESDMRIAASRANQLRSSSNFYNFLGHSVNNTIGHSYTVGNSYAGYGYANDYLLTGATLQKQAQAVSSEAVSMSGPARMAMLRQQWAQVE